MTTTAQSVETLPCKPNISASGERMRARIGVTSMAITAAAIGGAMALRVPWAWRALAFLPASLSAVSLLQARRHTCVARAREGTFEHEDFSKTKAPDHEVADSRRVAAGIKRDSMLIGFAAAALAMATALVR
jgi:hypothetical protein